MQSALSGNSGSKASQKGTLLVLSGGRIYSTGIAAAAPESIGEEYEDGSGNKYLPLIVQPIVVYEASGEHLARTRMRALSRGVVPAIYTEGMFQTMNDQDNRAVVKSLASDDLDLVGLALRADRKIFDKIIHGLKLHS